MQIVKKETEVSGELLFLRFAGPCVPNKFLLTQLGKEGGISQDDFDKINLILENDIKPKIDLLERCFRNAVDNYRECKLCRESGYEADFSYASVLNHLRHHHGHDGDCSAKLAQVSLINSGGIIIVISNNRKFVVVNPYGLQLKPDNFILVHRLTAITKIQRASP
jgi:hypothetical protein